MPKRSVKQRIREKWRYLNRAATDPTARGYYMMLDRQEELDPAFRDLGTFEAEVRRLLAEDDRWVENPKVQLMPRGLRWAPGELLFFGPEEYPPLARKRFNNLLWKVQSGAEGYEDAEMDLTWRRFHTFWLHVKDLPNLDLWLAGKAFLWCPSRNFGPGNVSFEPGRFSKAKHSIKAS